MQLNIANEFNRTRLLSPKDGSGKYDFINQHNCTREVKSNYWIEITELLKL